MAVALRESTLWLSSRRREALVGPIGARDVGLEAHTFAAMRFTFPYAEEAMGPDREKLDVYAVAEVVNGDGNEYVNENERQSGETAGPGDSQ